MNADKVSSIYEDLLNLGYTGPIKNLEDLKNSFTDEPPNAYFIDAVVFLSTNLISLLNLESRITVQQDGASSALSIPSQIGLSIEMSTLLRELKCPIHEIISGNVEDRLNPMKNKILIMEYLIQELKTSRMIAKNNLSKGEGLMGTQNAEYGTLQSRTSMKVQLAESETAKKLKEMLISLKFSKPPSDIQAPYLFEQIWNRILAVSQPLLPEERVKGMLFAGVLTDVQWVKIEELYRDFYKEYQNRREMGITRLSLTISSFLWDNKKKQEISNFLDSFKKNVKEDPCVEVSDILAATADMTIEEKVSSGAACKNTKSAVNKVKIGEVPDRGGRPNEQRPPPPEIPSWQPRNEPAGRGSRTSSSRPSETSTRSRGNDFHASGDHRARPVEMGAPLPFQVAGDNFAQFGNVPIGRGQQGLHGMNPGMSPVNYQFPPQHGWGVSPGRGGGGQGTHVGPYGGGGQFSQGGRGRQQGGRFQRGGQGRGGWGQDNDRSRGRKGNLDGFGGFGGY